MVKIFDAATMIIGLVAILASPAFAEEAAKSSGSGIGGWAAMAVIGILSPMLLAWAKRKVPAMVADFVLGKVRSVLAGKGIEDQEVKQLVHDLVLVLVRFAERKIPDDGFGAQRLELILSTAEKVPIVAAWVRKPDNREALKAIIADAVKRLDEGLKGVEPPGPQQPPPA